MINKNRSTVITTFFLILVILSSNISLSVNIISKIENNDLPTCKISDNENFNIIKLENIEISELEPGDIMLLFTDLLRFESDEPGHTRLVIEYEESHNRLKCIESLNRVEYTYVYPHYLLDELWIFARVEGVSEEQKQNAIDFAITQLGRPFQYYNDYDVGLIKNYNPKDVNDPYADYWYCSEIIWAAYYNCNNPFPKEEPEGGYEYGEGIDIDYNGWEEDTYFQKEDIYVPSVYPGDILLHDDVNSIIGTEVNISVSVKSLDNSPINGATVKLLASSNPNSEPISTKITDENGNCTFLKQETNINIYSKYWVSVNCEKFNSKTLKVPKRNYGFEVLEITLQSKSKERKIFSIFLFDLLTRLLEKKICIFQLSDNCFI